MDTKWYFRECHNCGHMEHIDKKNVVEMPCDLSNHYKIFCRRCEEKLQDSNFKYDGPADFEESVREYKERIKSIRDYQHLLFEKYATGNEAIAQNFKNREIIEKDVYREELQQKRYNDPRSLRNVLIIIPRAFWIVARDLFGVFKKDLTDMMGAKGSTIIFWDDCNHHKK